MNLCLPKDSAAKGKIRVRAFGCSDTGKMRRRNEDRFFIDDARRVYAVADGLGGLPGGALASQMAVDCLGRYVETVNGAGLDFHKFFQRVNEKIAAEGRKISREIGIGTTLTAVSYKRRRLTVAHVGDCVAYLFRGGACQKLTVDHTMEEDIRSRMKPGEDLPIPEAYAHILTRCVGQEGALAPDVGLHEIRRGDRVLICSDGITKTLDNNDLLYEILRARGPETYGQRLIGLANDRGGPDNATAVCLFFD